MPTSTAVSVIAVAFLVAAATWVSLRTLAAFDLSALPAVSRTRVAWWLRHHRQLDALCALVAASAAVAAVVAGVRG